MRWKNGTLTTIEIDGIWIVIVDSGPRIPDGVRTLRASVYDVDFLADEHRYFALLLDACVRQAMRNSGGKNE